MRYLYSVKTVDGELLHVEAENSAEAIEKLGLRPEQVKRSMPVKWLDKPAMSEDVKARLQEIKRERRELRRTVPDYCPTCGEINCPGHAPRFEPTKAGMQGVIGETPARTVPDAPLRAKRAQTSKPTLLEMYESEVRQGKLF